MRRTLEWLGLDWDEGPVIQSDDLAPYLAAIERLAANGHVFPCALTRGEIAVAASAPQESAHELVYPSQLRPTAWEKKFSNIETNWRFFVPEGTVIFDDAFAGPQSFTPTRTIGDFIVWTKRGMPAYQLAVVVDDHRQGITDIVRGDDLLESAARQLLLYRGLGLTPEPRHWHVPLLVGPDGKRLAKRHGDARLNAMRAAGNRPQEIIGVLARWCGIPAAGPMSAAEFRDAFDPARLPRDPIVYQPSENGKIKL